MEDRTLSRGTGAGIRCASGPFSGCWLVLCVCFVLAVPVASAQVQAVPRIDDAVLIFDQALDAFQDGDYGMAYRRFRLIYETYPLNTRTTAAYLMAGKALYRDGQYREAASLLQAFISRYPTSGYLDAARTTLGYAQSALGRLGAQREVVDLGIILPLGGGDATLSQAMFNGIRMAVDEHNALPDVRPVRMVFRDTQADPDRARAAVNELAVDEQVTAVVGPLYSDEARAAAAVAERAGVVMVAPLATDEDVSQGRRFVFQANPTISMRGALMGRFAVRGLRINTFGIVAQRGAGNQGALGERMAESFMEAAMAEGGQVQFYKLLDTERGWSQLDTALGADTLRDVGALYLPVAGARARTDIGAALSSLDRMDVGVRVLGNAEWHDLPFTRQASAYVATYTSDFNVDEADPQIKDFERRYTRLAGDAPDPASTTGRLAFTGYDVTRFLIEQIEQPYGSRDLRQRLRDAPLYQGLGIRLDFVQSNVNEAMYYFRYRDGVLSLLR